MNVDWRKLAARMRSDLDRADLTGRARRLAELSIKVTLMQGRTRVVIPKRQRLCDLLQIGKNHVAEVLAALTSARILHVSETADGWELLVYPDSTQWAVDWLYSPEAMAAYLAEVNQAPGQCQGELLEPAPNLRRVLAEVSAETASSQIGNNSTAASNSAESRSGAVPKTGTPFKAAKPLNASENKRLLDSEALKGALLAIEGSDESRAMEGIRQILGETSMINYGGMWRNNWRRNRSKAHRVLAAVVEDMRLGKVRSPGGWAGHLWKQFAD